MHQTLDYYDTLGEVLRSGSEFVVIVEDDVEVADGFGDRAIAALETAVAAAATAAGPAAGPAAGTDTAADAVAVAAAGFVTFYGAGRE
eukprot:SAG22_NODE_3510_length_1672_cov_1.221233_1_plen_88_part_00